MFSINKKSNPVEEKPQAETPLVKKVERTEDETMESVNTKKSEVRIGETATITGTIRGSCITIIDGCFEGNVDLDADLVLSKTGVLRADIKAKNTFISGNMEGTIYATDSVQIMPTAVVNGNIASKVLVIERGAKFTGNSQVIEDDAKPSSDTLYNSYPLTTKMTTETKKDSEE